MLLQGEEEEEGGREGEKITLNTCLISTFIKPRRESDRLDILILNRKSATSLKEEKRKWRITNRKIR